MITREAITEDIVISAADYVIAMGILMFTIGFAVLTYLQIFLFYSYAIIFSAVAAVYAFYSYKSVREKKANFIVGITLGVTIVIFTNVIFSYVLAPFQNTLGLSIVDTESPLYGISVSPTSEILLLESTQTLSPIEGFFVSIMFHVCLIAPTEELFFRYAYPEPIKWVLQRFLKFDETTAYAIAYVISSTLFFGIAHSVAYAFNAILLMFTVVAGIELAAIRTKYGLYASIWVHRLNNILSKMFALMSP